MNASSDRARQIQRHIADLLRRNWDPLGVADHPETSEEYDSYVGGVYKLLTTGASAKQVAEHLVRIETAMLGYEDTKASTLVPIAKKLLKIRDAFGLEKALPNMRMKLSCRSGHLWRNPQGRPSFFLVAAPARSLCAIR